ncbi:LOW QUALITY PROTEIN: hypothetical protein CAL7102_09409 [Dulcicalothrix desertica PCC 7102]|nr:LOW QUALITY PROTEIN: hypothetical protein CAL7102_09409 [Dulcicalothrix desertica PCC 7102]
MGIKYIIGRTDWREEHGTETRQLAHTGAITDILVEHFDSNSGRPIPQPGYRPREFHRTSQFADPRLRGASTHSRVGDWEVMRVEQYPSGQPDSDFETIVICYYRYSPVTTPLKPLSKIQTTQAL